MRWPWFRREQGLGHKTIRYGHVRSMGTAMIAADGIMPTPGFGMVMRLAAPGRWRNALHLQRAMIACESPAESPFTLTYISPL